MLMNLAVAVADGLRSLSYAADGGSADNVGGAACWYSSSYVPVFNGAGLFTERLFSRDTMNTIDAYFAQRGRPYSLVTVDGLVPDSTERLRALDYLEFDSSPAMWLDGPTLRWHDSPNGLRISRVQTSAELGAFRSILSHVFTISDHEVNLVLGDRVLELANVRHYLAWLGSNAIATTSLVLSGPIAGIWNVGTLHDYRRRGVAAELMHHSISDALALGYKSSMLLASQVGLPMYERLGYRTVSTVRMFERGA